jgi:starch synthase
MKVALSTLGKFHAFDLARQLNQRGALAGIFSAYPYFKLKNEGIPQNLIGSYPYFQAPLMALPWGRWLSHTLIWDWKYFNSESFDKHVANNFPQCDLFVGMSGSALISGKQAHHRGVKFVCDRGSAHIQVQNELLREEYDRWGLPFFTIDPRMITKEEAEYSEADAITVPSRFALQTFLAQGVDAEKLRLLPYGVDVSRFNLVAEPVDGRFDILFVGGMTLQKGVQYLVQTYRKIIHPAKSLTFVGMPSEQLIKLLKSRGLWPDDVKVLGHIPQHELKSIMSRSHVLVLPSIQDGFGMVMAQAMACGCPVVASAHTGAEDLFNDGQEGYIVPIRDVDKLAERLQTLADHPEQRATMSQRSLARVQALGGWQDYGDKAMAIYNEALQK